MAYDAFISYSHAADGRLAPAVQDGLQRLARPWYRLRALHVFRDQTGLAVNPHLWQSIQNALDESDYFILMCSPDAAASPWVEREVNHWLATKRPEHILPVLTAGAIAWDNTIGDFSAASAVPAALRGVFTEEPRFSDLRWAHDEEQLDLRHSKFREGVAELAAPIHGVSKDQLEGEDIRLYRRARRLVRAAVFALILLASSATVASAFAVNNASRARDAEAEAQDETERAVAAEELARDEADRAREAEARASDEAERALAAEATAFEEAQNAQDAEADAQTQAELARAAEAVAIAEAERADAETANAQTQAQRADAAAAAALAEAARADQEAENAQTEAANATSANSAADASAQQANASAAQAEAAAQEALAQATRADAARQAALAEAARADAAAEEARAQAARADAEAAEVGRQLDLASARALANLGLSQALNGNDYDNGLLLGVEALRRAPDDAAVREAFMRTLQTRPAHLVRHLPRTRSFLTQVTTAPDGAYIALVGGDLRLLRADTLALVPTPAFAEVLDVTYSTDGRRLAVHQPGMITVLDLPSGAVVGEVPAPDVFRFALDATGDRIALVTYFSPDIQMIDVATGATTTIPVPADVEFIEELRFSPDGTRIAIADPEPSSDVFLTTQFEIREIDATTGAPAGPVALAHDGPCRCFTLRPIRLSYGAGGAQLTTLSPGAATAQIVWDTASMTPVSSVTVPDLQPGEVVADVSPGGSLVVTAGGDDGFARVRNAATGERLGAPFSANLQLTFGSTGSLGSVSNVQFTADGTQVIAGGVDGKVRLYSVVAPKAPLVERVTVPGLSPDDSMVMAPNGSIAVTVNTYTTALVLYDPATGAELGPLTPTASIAPGVVFSRDGSRLAAAGFDDPLTPENENRLAVYDTATRTRLFEIEMPHYGSATFDPDANVVAFTQFTADFRLAATLYNANTGALLHTFEDPTTDRGLVGFTPDGRTAVLGSFIGADSAVDVATGADVPIPAVFANAAGQGLTFSDDGTRAAFYRSPGTTVVLDTATGATVAELSTGTDLGFQPQIALSADGSLLVASGASGTTRIWDVHTLLPFGSPFTAIGNAVFAPDTSELVAMWIVFGQPFEFVHVTLDSAEWRAEACAVAAHELSASEWNAWVGGPRQPSCN